MLTLWRTTPRFPTLADEVTRLMADVALGAPAAAAGFAPPADVSETATGFRVAIDLPGVDPKAVSLRVENDTLSVTADRPAPGAGEGEELHRRERAFGTFHRSFTLPATVDAARVEAAYAQGVLTVTLPKRDEARARTIPVRVA